MFPLLDLPNELLFLIGEALESDNEWRTLCCLVRTSRRFANIFTPNLNNLAIRYPERLRPEEAPLEWAIMRGNVGLAKAALDSCIPEDRVRYQNMALHWAAASKFTSREIIKFLLDNGAELESPRPNCLTPLHIAAFCGRPLAAQILLEHGANPRSEGPIGNQQPLYFAVGCGFKMVTEILLRNGATVCLSGVGLYGQKVLHLATRYPSILKILLERGGKDVLTETDYLSPIHWAARDNITSSIELLLEAGADIEAQHMQGPTPLHLAIIWKQIESVQVLLEHGADITRRSTYEKTTGYTALHLAAVSGSRAIVEVLLEYGAEINSCTSDTKQTALQLAAMIGDNDMVQYLLDRGININARDESGMTALHFAMKNGYAAVIDRLILNHADVTIQDVRGRTALQFTTEPWWRMGKQLRKSTRLLLKKQYKTLTLQSDQKRLQQLDQALYFPGFLRLLGKTIPRSKADTELSDIEAVEDEETQEKGIVFPCSANFLLTGLSSHIYFYIYTQRYLA